MGRGLADGITQGGAGPDEFRTAPLWGVGQRVFFLHDGRTSNLVEAIEDRQSPGSEANRVIARFRRLSTQDQQDIIDFLRSLERPIARMQSLGGGLRAGLQIPLQRKAVPQREERKRTRTSALHHSGMPKNSNRSAASYFFLAAFALLRSSSSLK
jgi:hypothetical protein